MSKAKKQVSEFSFSGRVLQVFFKGSRPKVLQLMTASGLYTIKLSKDLRSRAERKLIPGAEIQVEGEKTLNLKNGTIKLKAHGIHSLGESRATQAPSPRPCEAPTSQKPAKILVCQKSDCRKRGVKAVCAALETELCDRGLQDRVTIEKTGCLKRCKLGPNLVVMPDKARYTQVKAEDVPDVIEKHLRSAGDAEQEADRQDACATRR